MNKKLIITIGYMRTEYQRYSGTRGQGNWGMECR